MVTRADVDQIERIAREAGAAILARAGAAVELKADASPVTTADRAAHASIAAALTAWTPDVPVVSEEGCVPDFETRRHWPRFWLVDPLDGTKEFVSGNGEYTVNIALIEGHEPIAGVVFAPALDEMYLAGRGLGSWKQVRGGSRERLTSSPPDPGAPLVVAESRSHPSAELEAFLSTVTVKRRVQAGSSLKFCWVADGRADIYPRFGPTMEWDTAAGDCVYRCSGVGRERWSPLQYNTPALRHERFVIGLPGATA
ncbi:MAG TPA: 3'(2'),5'-bisphosphate nucleotidase CysQ [Vicinamibacterales bacterium]|nr:3'(2'),5'-bisphosphate nucleotidase CysQ [Vicinamibacterales bacterium]